jgi:thiamine kinase-like enzyme
MDGEVVKDLSSPHTKNRVYLYESKKHGLIVKKEFFKAVHFKREVEAMTAVNRALHPAVYKIDMKRKHLYLSYHPLSTEPESRDECAAKLMKHLHESTKQYGGVRDPGTGQAFTSWKEYLKQKVFASLEVLQAAGDFGDQFYQKWNDLRDSPFSAVSYIHRDVRFENIGERNGQYLLMDFEHAIIGDPYWDVARYALESAQSKRDLYQAYGVDDPEKADAYIRFFALEYAAYFVKRGQTDLPLYKRC